MRKAISLILVVLLLFPCLTAYASGNSYRLNNLGLSVDIPSDLLTFTRNIKQDDPILEEFGMTKAEMESMMKDHNYYLDAWDYYAEFEIAVSMTDSSLNDFYYFSNTELSAFLSALVDRYIEIGITVIKSEIYEHPQAKFAKIIFEQSSKGETLYGLEYYTVYDGKAIDFTMYSYSGSLTSKNETMIKQIVDSVKFDISPQKEPAKETPPFTYTDKISGASFTVPANWEQVPLSKERDFVKAKFSSTQEEGCTITYGCADVWAEASAEDRKGYTRAGMNNSFISKEDIAEIYGISVSQVELVTLGGKDFYKVTQEKMNDVNGINISCPITELTRIDNGYMYTFCFLGSTSSAQYSEFENMISSMSFPTTAENFDVSTIKPIIEVGVAVAFIAVGVTIWATRNNKKVSNSEPVQSRDILQPAKEPIPPIDQTSSTATEEVFFCHMCGTRLPAESVFCYKCGTKVIKE